MPKPISVEKLKLDAEVCEILAGGFDFDLSGMADDPGWFRILPDSKVNIIARDGAGGFFLLYGPQQFLLYVTSEGQAGVIARSLTEGIEMMVALPYWQDLLKFSGGGQLREMRRVEPFLSRSTTALDQDTLKKRLSLETLADPIASLHAAVSELGEGIYVVGPDGSNFESLFNQFTVESNPMWAVKK